MKIPGLVYLIAAAVFLTIDSGVEAQAASPLTVAYRWSNGTVAPQYYEVHRITIHSDGDSEFLLRKGIDGPNLKERKARFSAEPAKLHALIEYIRSNHLDAPPAPDSSQIERPRPGDGSCHLDFVVRGNSYGMPCSAPAVPRLLAMISDIVPASVKQQVESAGPLAFAPPMTFGGGEPDYATVSVELNADFSYELSILHESIGGPIYGQASRQQGRWSYDAERSLVTLHPNDPALKEGSLTIAAATPLRATLQEPGLMALRLTLQPPAPIPDGHPPVVQRAPDPFPAEHRKHEIREISIKTVDGHWLTAADGGGYGGPDDGPDAVALHSDATRADVWERFDWIWLDQAHTKFALRTIKGTYVTAVNGGGIGGPNDGRSPIHTDAPAAGVDEIFLAEFLENGAVTLRTRKGFYVTAVNGGGYGGPNTVPVHTDATSIGPWETFTMIFARR